MSNLTWTGGRAKLVWMKRLISSSSSSEWNNQIDAQVTFLSETKWQFGAKGFHYPIRKAEEKCNQPVGLVWSPCTFLQFVQSSFHHEQPKWVVVFLIPRAQMSCYTIPRLKTQTRPLNNLKMIILKVYSWIELNPCIRRPVIVRDFSCEISLV